MNKNSIIKTFNLKDSLERTLARIYSFYEVLNGVENEKGEILYGIVSKKGYEFHGNEGMGNDFVSNDYSEELKRTVVYFFSEEIKEAEKMGRFTEAGIYLELQEFNLLMQIYFGLYQEKELKKKLEDKEKRGEYEEIKEILTDQNWLKKYKDYRDFVKDYLSQPKVQEYLKLELMRKNTRGAFGGIEIEKIYDKDWSEEKQKKHIKEINKEFGEEVIVEEEKVLQEQKKEKEEKEETKKGLINKIKDIFK